MPKTRGLLLTSSFFLWTVTSVQFLLVAGFPQPCPSHRIVSSISFVTDKIVNNTILSFLLPQYEFSTRSRRKCHQIFCSPSFSRADLLICRTFVLHGIHFYSLVQPALPWQWDQWYLSYKEFDFEWSLCVLVSSPLLVIKFLFVSSGEALCVPWEDENKNLVYQVVTVLY